MTKTLRLLTVIVTITILLGCGYDFFPSDEDLAAFFADAEHSALHFEYEYDEAERIVMKRALNHEDELQWFETYEYGEAGHVIRSERYDNSDPAERQWYSLYEHNEAGLLSREAYYSAAETLQWYRTFEYSEAGNLTRKDMYDGEGALQWFETYEYDEEDRKTGTARYSADDTLEWRMVSVYEDAVLTRISWFDGEDALTCYEEYAYDEEGRITRESTFEGPEDPGTLTAYTTYDYRADGCFHYTFDGHDRITYRAWSDDDFEQWAYGYVYDEDGLLSEKTSYINKQVYYTSSFTYDEQSRLTGVVAVFGEDASFTYTFEYDEDGALIQATYSIGDEEQGAYAFEYDTAGSKSRIVLSDAEGATLGTYVYEYDYDGEGATRITAYTAEDEIDATYTYTFDDEERVARIEARDASDALLWYYLFGYDDNGNRVAEEKYTAEDELLSSSTFEFEFIFR